MTSSAKASRCFSSYVHIQILGNKDAEHISMSGTFIASNTKIEETDLHDNDALPPVRSENVH